MSDSRSDGAAHQRPRDPKKVHGGYTPTQKVERPQKPPATPASRKPKDA